MRIAQVQQKILSLLAARSPFREIELIAETYGDLENRLRRAFTSARPAVIVHTPEGTLPDRYSRTPLFSVRYQVDIVKPHAAAYNLVDAAEEAVVALQHQTIQTDSSPLRLSVTRFWASADEGGKFLAMSLEIETKMQITSEK